MQLRASCAVVLGKLGAHHDGELTIEAQVAVEAHCSRCAACSERLRAFSDIQGLLRRGAVTVDSRGEAEVGSAAAVATSLSATLGSVVHQALSEKREEWSRRIGLRILGAPRVGLARIREAFEP